MAESAAELVRRWYRDAACGSMTREETVEINGRQLPKVSLAMTTMRYLNGLGVDRTDPNGEELYAFVTEAMKGEGSGSESERYDAARAKGMR